ncbi:TRP-domain-containing protein [Coniochaeta ligniaria NRRL 30616]|uniref:TRP-domain-containing protein n=1 Tax=Coniochaeta ligniaria NRRL 30616 TaxID=1408157 RepID=A0A1J7JYM5_9PEZI|nr:TRP-domain-containing protein [Coniochaeta ligniaria NRRL 30616]
MAPKSWQHGLLRTALAVAVLAKGVMSTEILQTSGFSSCNTNSSVSVQRVNISYNNDNKTVTFDVAGTSSKVQNVTAVLNVTAYGQQIYSNSFDPCAPGTFVEQLCPVPAGTFAAKGTQAIPKQYADLVPSIAFQIPDIAAMATLQLRAKDSGEKVACIQSQVTNGKTASIPAVSYVAAGVAGAALVLTGVSAVGAVVAGGSAAAGSSAAGGLGTISPSFTEVFGWFQGMAMNGMLSVQYPQVYRSFAKNFGFSTGLVPWVGLQRSIDGFRNMTGGNLTTDSVDFLHNATLVFDDGSTNNTALKIKRAVAHFLVLSGRDFETSINGTSDGNSTSDPNSTTESIRVAVNGIQAYVNELSIPSANTFMTVLLIVAIVIAAIAVGILLVKVILEFWALFGSFPKSLTGFRKHYWGSIARAITSLILLLYGVWVLYCIFQFTHGDSWAAKTLAGVTLGVFTGILVFFSWKIWWTARKLKMAEGDASALYDDKDIWVKYSLFYESYKKDYWWIFVPTILYMFAKGFTLAAADGHGMVQTIAQLVIEGIMLILLLWSRPYERKSSNVINIVIQVVRVLSVVCILVFVEEFGIAQTTQTVTGVVLIAVQSTLTGVLAILIAWNAIVACCKENPHRKRRKEMGTS